MTTDLTFFYSYFNLPGVWKDERVEYYAPASRQRLRDELRGHIEHQLDLFSKSCDYGDYFSAADYYPEDVLPESELPIFRSALDIEDRASPLDELHPLDVLRGYRAVLRERLSSDVLADIHSAADLFNNIIESAMDAADEQVAQSFVRINTAKEFGPWFLDGIMECVERSQDSQRQDVNEKHIGERFRPMWPLLEMLRNNVQHEGWPQSDICLGHLLLIVDYFKSVVEEKVRS